LEAFEAENWGGKVFLTATGMSLIIILLAWPGRVEREAIKLLRGRLIDRNKIRGITFTRSSGIRRPYKKDI